MTVCKCEKLFNFRGSYFWLIPEAPSWNDLVTNKLLGWANLTGQTQQTFQE